MESTGSGRDCFLTTACVEYLGKEDDCYELTTLRRFRDEYLLDSMSGQLLVKEYYEIAPLIVEQIEKKEDKGIYYKKIYEYVLKCLELYNQNNKLEKA